MRLNLKKRFAPYATRTEFSRAMAAYARDKYELDVHHGSIETVPLGPESFDVIAAWGVFTIIRQPVDLLRKLNKALKMGGVLAFNTYYHESLWARVWGCVRIRLHQAEFTFRLEDKTHG